MNDLKELNLLLEHVNKLDPSPEFLPIKSVTSKSIIVVSCGLLEKYLKESFMEFIEELNNHNIPKKYIKDQLWITNKNNTLEALRLISENRLDSDYGNVVIDYASSFKKDKRMNKPVLIKEAFSIMKYNPGSATIKDMFDNIGIKIFRKELFNIKFVNVGIAKDKLDSLISLRNSFAHGDSGVTIPSLSDVQEYLEFLEDFIFILNKVLNDEISDIEIKFYIDLFKFYYSNLSATA
ncbi:MAG TPA: MAE_28990/MAE_18760 family HEPN-like nuclease [Candidatus Methanoperedens sp.]